MMKKRLFSISLVLALFLSATVPVYATEDKSSELTPPPELIILEGEEWIPNAPDPSLKTRGVDDDCRHNSGHPANYRYIGAVKGSTSADVKAVNLFLSLITVKLPAQIGVVLDLFTDTVELMPGDELHGEYIKYQYIYNVGPDPNMYWFHSFFQFATKNGKPVGNQCYATYSPKKSTSDPYQD